jgi:predicted CoA-binding protein
MQAAATTFFASPHFAVAGASATPGKGGYNVLSFYHTHSLPVTAINPSGKPIAFSTKSYDTITSVSSLSDPANTALSIVTGPAITKGVLTDAKKVGVKAVWFQPGTYDDEILAGAKGEFEVVVGGKQEGTEGKEGWCVIADGERCLKEAGRKWESQEA